MKEWSPKQLGFHIEAARLLCLIKDEIYSFLSSNKSVTEKETISFIKKAYERHGLINDHKKEQCIVAFGENTKHVHYFPTPTSNLNLKPNTLILVDLWARLETKDSPYADMTWMFYRSSKLNIQKSKLELEEIQMVWKVLIKARDEALSYTKKEIARGKMPRGLDIDRSAHDVIGKAGLGKGIKHTIGHSLGFKHPHGDLPGINWKEYSPLFKNVGYTIEPGIYLEKFGLRTEIDFYIDKNSKVIITTPIQMEIDLV